MGVLHSTMPARQCSAPLMSEKLQLVPGIAGKLSGAGPHLQSTRIRTCSRILSLHDISHDPEESFAPDPKPLPKPAAEKHDLTVPGQVWIEGSWRKVCGSHRQVLDLVCALQPGGVQEMHSMGTRILRVVSTSTLGLLDP